MAIKFEQYLEENEEQYFTIGDLINHLNTLDKSIPVGVRGHFGEFNSMNKHDFWITTAHDGQKTLQIDVPDIGPEPD